MHVPSANSTTVPLSANGHRRRLSVGKSKEDNVVNIIQEVQPKFRALIVDRDSMSSDVLAEVLMGHGGCDAIAVSPSHLLHTLSTREVDLVVVGADLNGEIGSGFDLAYKVSCGHPDTGIVMLLNCSTRESVINAFRSGARGVFSRQQAMSEFLHCVEGVRKGFIWAGKEHPCSQCDWLT
jgi:two-component system nitrate/nitrite response regulator NarL